jgi:hypothetical protein
MMARKEPEPLQRVCKDPGPLVTFDAPRICSLLQRAPGVREFVIGLDGDYFLAELYGRLLYLRVARLQVEQYLDDKALVISIFEVATTPTIEHSHHYRPYVCFPRHALTAILARADELVVSSGRSNERLNDA